MSFQVADSPISGVKRVQRRLLEDERGCFTRLFCAQELAQMGWAGPVVQINHSRTRARGTVRGLHYQRPPYAEMKLVSCVRGEVWDVAVDVRAGSPTFLRWHAERLSARDGTALLIPPGCAHGFQALSDEVELVYCHSQPYRPQEEAGLSVTDPRLQISWPLPVSGLSQRDTALGLLASDFSGVVL